MNNPLRASQILVEINFNRMGRVVPSESPKKKFLHPNKAKNVPTLLVFST